MESKSQRADFTERAHVLDTHVLDVGMKCLKKAVVALSLDICWSFQQRRCAAPNIMLASNNPGVASGVILFIYLLNLYAMLGKLHFVHNRKLDFFFWEFYMYKSIHSYGKEEAVSNLRTISSMNSLATGIYLSS